MAGCSLHAGVAAKAHERKNLEQLCRDVFAPNSKLGEYQHAIHKRGVRASAGLVSALNQM